MVGLMFISRILMERHRSICFMMATPGAKGLIGIWAGKKQSDVAVPGVLR